MESKITETNYRTFFHDVQLFIDESFAERINPANDSVRLLDEIVEKMDAHKGRTYAQRSAKAEI